MWEEGKTRAEGRTMRDREEGRTGRRGGGRGRRGGCGRRGGRGRRGGQWGRGRRGRMGEEGEDDGGGEDREEGEDGAREGGVGGWRGGRGGSQFPEVSEQRPARRYLPRSQRVPGALCTWPCSPRPPSAPHHSLRDTRQVMGVRPQDNITGGGGLSSRLLVPATPQARHST